MHDFKRRMGQGFPGAGLSRLAVFCLFALLFAGLPAPAAAADLTAADETLQAAEVKAAAENILRNYQEAAMLYEEQDLRTGTVAELPAALSGEAQPVFRLAKEDLTLEQLRENMIFLEKKARFYSGMRQLQEIYRTDLLLFYDLGEPELTENTGRISVKETAQFRYTGSDQLSVYETYYTVRLVKPGDRWLVADVTDGSRFDKLYKDQGAAFDEGAALAEFAASLEREDCTVSYPYTPSAGEGRILYDGASAAAYAYTYSLLTAGMPRSEFYNPLFVSYAGEGGDCMNFASQCMWAGFGGSQDNEAAAGRALPMDTEGDSQWFGRSTSQGKINLSWVSCQSFRKYLTGSTGGTGLGGSNAAGDAGMYATILDAASGSPLSGVTPEELVGAAAHVEGSGGSYSHAIVLTAATGNKRSEIWFCGHTKDITHVKLGDYYIWPIKVYIPRCLRTGEGAVNPLRSELLAPVAAGNAGWLSVRADTPQQKITITVTTPEGAVQRVASAKETDLCRTEYTFSLPGLYRVECAAKAPDGSGWTASSYYVRCYVPLLSKEEAEDGDALSEEESVLEEEAEEPAAGEAPEDFSAKKRRE